MNKDQSLPGQDRLPLIPLRDLVVFPETVVHFDIGRPKSIAALNAAMEKDKKLIVSCQRDAQKEDPQWEDLYTVGTVVTVKQVMRLPDEQLRLLVSGDFRAAILGATPGEMITADYIRLDESSGDDELTLKGYMRAARKLFTRATMRRGEVGREFKQTVMGERRAGVLADIIAANLLSGIDDKQAILECREHTLRLATVCELMAREIELADLSAEIEKRVHENIDKNNRDYYLREQMRVIGEELGEADDEVDAYEKRLQASAITGEARARVEKEIKRLKRMGPGAPENAVSQNYIECMLELPWGVYDRDEINLPKAKRVLEADHFGLEDVKKRILEHLAVRLLKQDMKGSILCLVGAPGVGKTSIARSVARAMGRRFCQMSLGGMRDEAEIRGHRRTYVAAMPGRVISSIRHAGCMNPVFLFDEIDKMASDYKGDPASAMLEVLDPEQNNAFRDHYLEAPFDLSRVMFITTANDVSAIPRALLDRMEVIEVSSYTLEEKVQIAKRHLWKKQLAENGLTQAQLRITDKAIREVIGGYTREAGVRSLERKLSAICRGAAVNMLNTPGEERALVTVKPEGLAEYLGAPDYLPSEVGAAPETGVANGLAWTSVGGEIMPIEAALMPGEGKLELTGSLGDVMKESAHIALSYIRGAEDKWGLTEEYRKKHDIHVHVPEGAVPKDGPSAGVALTCAMLSALTGLKARQDIAMTGEISLRGHVLPIGGLKEKLLAAYRAGIRVALIPRRNEKDLEKLPSDVRREMDIRLIENVDEAARLLLSERTLTVKAVV